MRLEEQRRHRADADASAWRRNIHRHDVIANNAVSPKQHDAIAALQRYTLAVGRNGFDDAVPETTAASI